MRVCKNSLVKEAELRVDQASPADAGVLAEIWHLGWLDGHADSVDPELVAVRTGSEFHRRMNERITEVSVARHNGEPAGFVLVVENEVEQIYVSRDHRGAGIAQALLAHAEQQIAAAGFNEAWLAVVAGNDRARAFYSKQGWADEGAFEYEAASVGGTIAVPSHRYVKPLT